MQKITITATTLNEAIQEVKKRFGENAVIQNTETINNQICVTVSVLSQNEPIIVPSMQQSAPIPNPLLAIRMIEEISESNYLGQNFKEFWLKCLSPYLTSQEINLAASLDECLNFETQWIRKIIAAKPVVFLGSYGSGKTQALAKTAATLIASGRKVEIYNLDTFKTSGQGMLQIYAAKLNAPYFFGKDALIALQNHTQKHENTIKLIDTQGTNLQNPQGLEWLSIYANKFNFDPVMIVPCDACVSSVNNYANFVKEFDIKNLILSKMDLSSSLGLPVRLAWLSEIPIAMVNKSSSLGENLEYLDAEKLMHFFTENGTTDNESNMSNLGIRF